MKLASVILLTAAASLAAAGQVLLKRGADGRSTWTDFLNLDIGGGLSLYALGTVLWILALSREPLIKAYAFTSLTLVFVYVGSTFVLKERMTASDAVGMALVVLGLILIASRSP